MAHRSSSPSAGVVSALLVVVAAAFCLIVVRADPPVPVWPSTFSVQFVETTKLISTHSTEGAIYYDAANNRERIDRDSGKGDRYCGSVRSSDEPCSQIIVNGMRWLAYPSSKYCCHCCDSSKGCGIVRQDWLQADNATYQGTAVVGNLTCDKWLVKGLQSNFWYQEVNTGIPCELDQVPNDTMNFIPSSYRTDPLPAALFELPTYCTEKCPTLSICSIASNDEPAANPIHLRSQN